MAFARAAAYLVKTIPGLTVQGYFVDFDGIWDADIENAGRVRRKRNPSPDLPRRRTPKSCSHHALAAS
jgi:hypothetical protein